MQLEQALQRYSIKQTACASSHCSAGMFLLRGNITSKEEITVALLLPIGTIRMSAKYHSLSYHTHLSTEISVTLSPSITSCLQDPYSGFELATKD